MTQTNNIKYCRKCDTTKPTTDFYYFRGKYLSPCRPCKSKYVKEYSKLNRKRYLGIPGSNVWVWQRRRTLKRRATKENVPFNLTTSKIRELYLTNQCTYCRLNFPKMTVDRINPRLGYTEDNCVACCMWCNIFKSNLLTGEEMKIVAPVLRVRQSRMQNREGKRDKPYRRSQYSAKLSIQQKAASLL